MNEGIVSDENSNQASLNNPINKEEELTSSSPSPQTQSNAQTSQNISSTSSQNSQAQSDNPDLKLCRICHAGEEEGKLFHPCKCSGSVKVKNRYF